MHMRLKKFIEYCSNHTVSYICSIPIEFLKRFLTRNCVVVFVSKEYGIGVSTYISTWIICCDGLTGGIAFVVKHKKSKIT